MCISKALSLMPVKNDDLKGTETMQVFECSDQKNEIVVDQQQGEEHTQVEY